MVAAWVSTRGVGVLSPTGSFPDSIPSPGVSGPRRTVKVGPTLRRRVSRRLSTTPPWSGGKVRLNVLDLPSTFSLGPDRDTGFLTRGTGRTCKGRPPARAPHRPTETRRRCRVLRRSDRCQGNGEWGRRDRNGTGYSSTVRCGIDE